VRVLLLHARFVVVLVATVMHEVELVHQAAGFEHLQGAINRHAVDLRILRFGKLEQAFGIEMLAGFVDEVQQNLPLPRKAQALLLERALHGRLGHMTSLRQLH
jgi:hypothetical protein